MLKQEGKLNNVELRIVRRILRCVRVAASVQVVYQDAIPRRCQNGGEAGKGKRGDADSMNKYNLKVSICQGALKRGQS